jgi:hypothetical protein
MGNSFILKPSEKSPLTAIRIAQLALDAGIPKGVFNVLPGYGHTVGKALALHMDVDVLAFTGSTAIAKQLMVYAGQSNMKRVWAEAGGKSANVVFADAPDLRVAAQAAAGAIAFNQGEVCTAGWWSARFASSSSRCWWKPCKPGSQATPSILRPPSVRSSTSVNWTTCCATSASAKSRGPN